MESELHEEDSDINNEETPSLKSAASTGEKGTGMSRTQKDAASTKKKRVSKTASMQAEFDARIKTIESNFDKRFDQLFNLVENRLTTSGSTASSNVDENTTNHNTNDQNRGFLPRSDCREGDVPPGDNRPILPLEPNLDHYMGSPRISRNTDFDVRSEISLQVNQRESDEFMESESLDDGLPRDINQNINKSDVTKKSDRFYKLIQNPTPNTEARNEKSDENSSEMRTNMLSKIFKEDVSSNKSSSSTGLIIDQVQVDILENSWRTKNPDKLTAYKDEYKFCFPIHDSTVKFLQVPSLDDLLEPMLRNTHGPKAVKTWENHRQLYTQPLKQVEKLAYQGQYAARMSIISNLYMQQALGTLCNQLENGEDDRDTVCQTVKDIFAMSSKALDQSGRTGAFFHLIRRKTAAQDSGLVQLKDIQSKAQYLPLTDEGVFGKGLETCLEKRKEQKEQIKDLLPELNRKRKSGFDKDSYTNKVPRINSESGAQTNQNKNGITNTSYSGGYNKGNFTRPTYTRPQPRDNNKTVAKDGNRKDKTGKNGAQSGWGSFRIPRKNDS